MGRYFKKLTDYHLTNKFIYDRLETAFKEDFGNRPYVLKDILNTCSRVLAGLDNKMMEKYPTMDDLILGVTQALGIPLRHIVKCNNREQEYVAARQLFSYLAKDIYDRKYTLKEIGQFLGGFDHTTVLHNIKSCKDRMETNEQIMTEYVGKWNKYNQTV